MSVSDRLSRDSPESDALIPALDERAWKPGNVDLQDMQYYAHDVTTGICAEP